MDNLLTYRCECGCKRDIDTVSFERLHEERESLPDELQAKLYIQFISHTPMDDYKIYEVSGELCLCIEQGE